MRAAQVEKWTWSYHCSIDVKKEWNGSLLAPFLVATYLISHVGSLTLVGALYKDAGCWEGRRAMLVSWSRFLLLSLELSVDITAVLIRELKR